MRKNILSKLLLIVLLFATLISNAQSPTAPALAFNVFAQNGCSFYSSETEGPVAMGGDLTIAGSYAVSGHGNFSYQVSGVNIGLLVGGKVNYNGGSSLQVLYNGYVKIGNQNGSTAWYLDNNNAGSPIRITPSSDYNGSPNILLSAHASDLGNVSAINNPIFQSGLIDFTTAFTTMKATATSMSGIAANADLTNPNGDFHSNSITSILNHTPGGQIKINLNSGNNILNVTGAELNACNNFTFNNQPDASHVLVINVNASGTFNWVAWTNGGFGGQSNCAYIIYNFYNTTTLNIGGNGAIEGTVFAPYADISKSGNNSNIEGQVICKSYSQSAGGEIHSANYIPNAPGCTLPTVADITGSSSLNVGATITLADATGSGTWSSSNTGVASVSSGGVVTGAGGGTATISYSVSNSCGTTTKTKSITVVRTDIDNKNCPSSFKRNNGDGSPQVVTVFASNVIGTTYYTNRKQPENDDNQGKVTFSYASSINYPPVITKSWVDGSVNWTWGNNSTGSPFNPPGVPSSNDVAYTFYNNNLPPANVLKFELTDPQTGQVINTCSYGSDGNIIVPPSNLNYSASATVCQGTAGNSVTPTVTASGTVTYSISGNPTGITINSTTGVISWTNAVAAAVYTMTVTASNTYAPNATFTYTLTVNPLAVIAGDITGTATVCKNATTTLANVTAGGIWSTSDATIATVSSGGVVTGVAAGTATITYSITNTCGTTSRTKIVTVNDVPAIGGDITGTATVCKNATTTLSNVTAGGTWSTNNTSVATVSSGGVVTGVAAGTVTITYSITNSCGTTSRTKLVTVNDVPAIGGDITGTATVCKNASTTLSNVTAGGVWSTSDATIATVNSAGVVTGVAAGTATITYSITNTCGTTSRTKLVTVNDVPAISGDITGTATVCKNATTVFSNLTGGGSWSTSDATIATVNPNGVVTGIAAATATITYSITNSCGTASRTKLVTVNDVPAISGDITGTAAVCKNANTTLSHGTAGGTWSSSNTSVATVSTGGLVTGITVGTATITYSITNSCGTSSRNKLVTVNELPAAPTVSLVQPTCNVATGSISVTAPSGIGMTYSDDGSSYQSAASFASLASGTYPITAKNANGCISSATSAIITNPPAAPATPTFTTTQPTCNIATGTITVASPTGLGYTYSIDAGSAQSSATFTSVAAGTHTITAIYAGGCSSAASVIINAQPATPAAATLSLIQPTCNIPTGTITVTAPTAVGYTYSIDGTNYQSGTTFSNLAVGTYSVTVKSAGGCISTAASAEIVKANKPTDFAYTSNYLTTTQPLSTNSFGFVVYGNAAGDTYSWDLGDGTISTSATPTKSYNAFGIYNVRLIATNTGGCSDTSYQTVVVTPASKPMDAVPVCNAATATTITQTLIFPRSTTDWASSNLKSQNAAKFDTTLGTLLAVKVINNGSFTTNNKVEITGNMAAGTKRLVNIQVDGTMDFYAPGFLYGITPPTIIDSFSSTGFDGVKDFAGTSGKNFGPHTSAKTDSTVFTSAASLANYKGTDSIALIVYTNTNFSASFPTGNDTASISTTATDTATIVYYYCPSSGGVSGGDGGGLESKSLGDAIVKRVYNKAFNSLQQPVDYSIMAPIGERTARATTMGVGAGKLTLADILPQHLSKYNLTSYISTPTDIPSITNASDVLSIDYTLNNQAKAVSFGTQTSNAVYDHTKAICDRLKGSVLIDLKNVLINNVPMVAYTLKTATGNTEYAMSFAIGAKTGRNSYTLQSNWLNQDYTADETMFNIQLWAVSPTMVTDMATDIINNLQSSMPVQAISAKKLPDTYITSGSRDRTDLVLSVTNNQSNSNGYFVIEDKSNELSTATTKRTVPFTVTANGKAAITVSMSDIYESTISMYINNQLQDVVYMADGTWSYGAGPSSNVTSFKVSNDTNKTYASDELPVFRNVQVSGNSSDYVSIFKLMKGGAVAQDLSAYKTLKFAAEGGYNLRVTLVKSSIVKWADQYNTLIPLDKASKEYLVSLDAFTSALSKDKINANDVTTIVFSIEVGNGQNNVLNTTLNSISFTKQEASYLQSLTAKEVQLYPNPATGNRFTCSFMSDKPAQLTLRVIDMTTGQVTHTQQVAAITGINNVMVDLNRKNAGSSVYIIALDGENVQYKKAKIIAGN